MHTHKRTRKPYRDCLQRNAIYIPTKLQSTHKMVLVFPNDLGDQDSIPGRLIPKTQQIVREAFLVNTEHYKVRIKG